MRKNKQDQQQKQYAKLLEAMVEVLHVDLFSALTTRNWKRSMNISLKFILVFHFQTSKLNLFECFLVKFRKSSRIANHSQVFSIDFLCWLRQSYAQKYFSLLKMQLEIQFEKATVKSIRNHFHYRFICSQFHFQRLKRLIDLFSMWNF